MTKEQCGRCKMLDWMNTRTGPKDCCRVMVKRAKFKHWFELGQHGPTDAAFEQALAAGTIRWNPAIEDKTRLFRKI